ncbi:MAG: TSUP family transporter, partial [Monoglobaceae bacterium]
MSIIIGFLSGIISGMGIGGGAILIPALILTSAIEQKLAQGINLVYFLPTAVFALIVHIKNKSVVINTALIIGICGVLGAVIGSVTAMNLN